MPRVPMIPAQAPEHPELVEILDRLRAIRGLEAQFPTLYRVLGNAPAMFRGWVDFAWPLRSAARSERRLRELLIMRQAQISGARYEWAHHLPMALEAGVTPAQLAALPQWASASEFDPRERAILQLADEVANGPAASEATIAGLGDAGFEVDEVVELVLTASFYVCVARFLMSMNIEPEPEYERYLDAGQCRMPPGLEGAKG